MILDYYGYRARLVPAFIMLAPVAIILYIKFPDATALWPTWTSLLVAFGFTFLLAELVRERGKRLEPLLYAQWGGMPSISILKYSRTWIDHSTLERRHRRLEKLINVVLPNQHDESSSTDDVYSSCNRYLLAQTRDKKQFELLFKENVSYGFRRNLLALKPIACALLFIVAVLVFAMEYRRGFPFHPSDVVGCIVLLGIAIIWIFYINSRWVHSVAKAYATQLCEAIDRL